MKKQPKIGIGVTIHNRNETARVTIENINKYKPINSKVIIVDDASEVPFEGASFRFNTNVGISVAKNKCLELLDDCDYIFLFDDDCYPIVKDWYKPYINSGYNHLCYTFDTLYNGTPNGNTKLSSNIKDLNVFAKPCGCMLFFTKKCIETAGGFSKEFDKYAYEHVELSNRIYNLGLTPEKYIDVKNSNELFYSLDRFCETESSVPDRYVYVRKNRLVFQKLEQSKKYVPYKDIPKKQNGNVILTSYFTYSNDPQRGTKWKADLSELMELIKSVEKQKQKLIVFSDCFDENEYKSEYIEFVKVSPSKTHAPNVYRCIVYDEWMNENDFDNIWFVDSTDVTLLKNPFDIIEPNVIYSGDECDMLTENRWMRSNQERYLKIKDYRNVIQNFGGERLLNCGVYGGHKDIIREFIKKQATLHKQYTSGLRYTTDMAVFNYLIRKEYTGRIFHGEQINTKFKYFEQDNKVAIWKHK